MVKRKERKNQKKSKKTPAKTKKIVKKSTSGDFANLGSIRRYIEENRASYVVTQTSKPYIVCFDKVMNHIIESVLKESDTVRQNAKKSGVRKTYQDVLTVKDLQTAIQTSDALKNVFSSVKIVE